LLQLYRGLSIEIVEREILVAYLNDLKQAKFTTHHKHQAVVTTLFNFAIEQGYIRANPISQLK
jgi:integrase/recombinase XerD